MKLLLIGSHGFVGSHVRSQLENAGHDLSCWDIKIGMPAWKITGPNFDGVEAIIWAAAHPDIQNNWVEGGVGMQMNDFSDFRAFLTVLHYHKWRGRIVFVSTASVYPDGGPWYEYDAPRPRSPYAASKIACEAWLEAYATRYEWEWRIPRLVACFGSGYTHGHVKDMVQRACENNYVWGLDDGKTRKQVVHVKDAADAICRLATADGAQNGPYNVASETLWNWVDTVTLMGMPIDWSLTKTSKGGWVGDVVGMKLDTKKIERIGWGTCYSVADGVKDALASQGWVKR